MPNRHLRHNAGSSKVLFKLLIVSLMIIQTILVAVGKNYYNRFIELENEDLSFAKTLDILSLELKEAKEKVESLTEDLRIINSHLMDDASDK